MCYDINIINGDSIAVYLSTCIKYLAVFSAAFDDNSFSLVIYEIINTLYLISTTFLFLDFICGGICSALLLVPHSNLFSHAIPMMVFHFISCV